MRPPRAVAVIVAILGIAAAGGVTACQSDVHSPVTSPQPSSIAGHTLDIANAQIGVKDKLTDPTNGYGAKNVEDVTCNDGKDLKIEKGDTFVCVVVIDGTKRHVTVTFLDDSGTYEVGRPR